MYVCMCTGVTSKQIKQHLEDGCQSVADLLTNTGAGGCCGSCVPMLQSMVEEFHTPALVMNMEIADRIPEMAPTSLDLPMITSASLKDKVQQGRSNDVAEDVRTSVVVRHAS